MASSFPSSIDSFPDPLANSPLNAPSHSALHQDVNDAVEKVEVKLGLGSSPASGASAGQVLKSSGSGNTGWSDITVSDIDSTGQPVGRVVKSSGTGSSEWSEIVVDDIYSTGEPAGKVVKSDGSGSSEWSEIVVDDIDTTGQAVNSVIAADGAGNAIWAFPKVLQVVNATNATTVSNSTTTPANTGLTATITPQSVSSKILVVIHQNGGDKSVGNAANAINLDLYRDTTLIHQIVGSAGYTNSLLNVRVATMSTMFLDSPATTSAVAYKTMFYNDVAAASVSVQINGRSSITLMEISA